ncbi:hypothetical protein RJ639_010965 [Escallonia herrerae]|uniref:Glycoside hydrolase 123 catalytic domain-containing protein n=1 Tax=Escallonia herrerae TaxID=1293975 RepID=A0AA88VQT5_9ASTE|nr:hypothetical protein RJ639_010965 [Escallonia herrerae]
MDNSGNHQDMTVPPVEGVAGGGTAYGWGDASSNDPSTLRGVIDPTKVPSSDLVHVWYMPSTANVGPQDMPRPLEPISLLAARNERESVQIAIRPKVSWGESGIAGVVQVERVKSATTSLRRVLQSPSFSDFFSDNGPVDMMDEDAISNLSIRLKLNITIWDFVLPTTPSLPTVIDRFGVEHGSNEWYEALDQHFKWLLQYRISPYFCRWGDSMRVLTYTSPWPGPGDAPLASNNFEAFLKVPEFLRPHTQIYCTSEWVVGDREDLVKDIIAEIQPENGEEWWTYVCMGPSDPHPNWHLGMRGTQHRAVMWRVWKEGGTGFLYWGANCYEKATVPSGEIRFRRGLPPGDGVLFYPGEVFSSSRQPVASVRLERLLSGLQDFEYFKLYASRFGRDESVALLEKTGMYLGPERYTNEHGPIDVMRGEKYGGFPDFNDAYELEKFAAKA